MLYFGFAIADSMFSGCRKVQPLREEITVEDVRNLLEQKMVSFCLNPNHKATIDVAIQKFGLNIVIPQTAVGVVLEEGDQVIVMSPRGLPRLQGRHEYTQEEIENATLI